MLVTINTDASYSSISGRGSFAYWVVSDDFKFRNSGVLKSLSSRPEVCEFKCILNALHEVIQKNHKSIRKIIINTDCLNVIHICNKDMKAVVKYKLNTKEFSGLFIYYNLLIKKLGNNVQIEFRHVKAHTTTDGARNWVNDWCDVEAKRVLSGKPSPGTLSQIPGGPEIIIEYSNGNFTVGKNVKNVEAYRKRMASIAIEQSFGEITRVISDGEIIFDIANQDKNTPILKFG